uniref:Uncharacterized protein n=1 Tax=Psilocybe cubensis TaxID=181762 RepID=A0A8H7XNR0_PSICU
MQKKHKATFIQFLSTFSATPEMLEQWKKQVEEWKANPSKPNSYKESTQTITLQNTRRNLQNKEAAMAAIGKLPAHSAHIMHAMVEKCVIEWLPLLKKQNINPKWVLIYPCALEPRKRKCQKLDTDDKFEKEDGMPEILSDDLKEDIDFEKVHSDDSEDSEDNNKGEDTNIDVD